MENNIFYSWQSDLPNNTNRGFIESCLSSAIKELSKADNFHLELNLDRDTKYELGTPDIVNTIFNKIEKAKFFVADISIINSKSKERKTPNPNVLIELGYASKVLGWDKIICIFNTDYGNLNDLPFDLRSRRILTYSLKDHQKVNEKARLIKILNQTINQLFTKGMLKDELNDYIKTKVDRYILALIRSLDKILHGYNNNKLEVNILKLERNEIKALLENRKFLGFQVFKNYEETKNELTDILKDITSSVYYKKELGVIIVNLINWLNKFHKLNSLRESPNLFINANEKSSKYEVVHSKEFNSENKDGYLLLEILDESSKKVVDFGEVLEKPKIDLLLNYVYLNDNYSETYTNHLNNFIGIVKKWLDATNNEFIIDDMNFDIKLREVNRNKTIKNDADNDFQEKLKSLIEDKNNFEYKRICHINSIIYLYKLGYVFKHHQKFLNNMQRYLKGEIKIRNNATDLFLHPVEEGLLFRERNQEKGLYLLNQARTGNMHIESIFIPHSTANFIECLLEISKHNSLPSKIKKIISEILQDFKENLFVHLTESIESYIVTVTNEKDLNIINNIDLLDDFNCIRLYHEKKLNMLKRELKIFMINRQKLSQG